MVGNLNFRKKLLDIRVKALETRSESLRDKVNAKCDHCPKCGEMLSYNEYITNTYKYKTPFGIENQTPLKAFYRFENYSRRFFGLLSKDISVELWCDHWVCHTCGWGWCSDPYPSPNQLEELDLLGIRLEGDRSQDEVEDDILWEESKNDSTNKTEEENCDDSSIYDNWAERNRNAYREIVRTRPWHV